VTQTEKCYGTVNNFFLHFKYPPTKEQLAGATTKSKIDPLKVGVPFLVVADCAWYRETSTKHPISGLTQIQPHPQWNLDCPLVRMQDCLPMNVVYWPAKPLELLEKLTNEINGEESKSSSPDDPNMVVITHHEEVPVVVNQKSKQYKAII
jgi:hypothetical protein